MAAHITVPQVTGDDTPASLSSVMLTDLLRGELGYQGLIVTDSLAMQAITDVYTPGQAAVKALQAGADPTALPMPIPPCWKLCRMVPSPSRDWTKACSAFCSANTNTAS